MFLNTTLFGLAPPGSGGGVGHPEDRFIFLVYVLSKCNCCKEGDAEGSGGGVGLPEERNFFLVCVLSKGNFYKEGDAEGSEGV